MDFNYRRRASIIVGQNTFFSAIFLKILNVQVSGLAYNEEHSWTGGSFYIVKYSQMLMLIAAKDDTRVQECA